ncbi:aldolase/citrate lyase family protein [Amylibacter sp.]|nr:aldolase/citrate lyase family protein [Amylibacter sp.]
MTQSFDSSNALKKKLNSGKVVMGMWSIIPSPVLCEIFGLSGLDFVILDMEHGIYDMTSLDACIRSIETTSASPLVRLPKLDAIAAQWALDLGSHGIVVPQIKDSNDAENVVEIAKFAPVGSRGYNPFTRAANYGHQDVSYGYKMDNAFNLTAVIIENSSALADIDNIINTDGIDVIYIGIYDLSVSLGFGGDTHHPELVNIAELAIRRIRALGKSAGMMVRTDEEIDYAVKLGANFLVYSVDTLFIQNAVTSSVLSLKKLSNLMTFDQKDNDKGLY